MRPLLHCPVLTTLDLSNNKLDQCGVQLVAVLEQMTHLRVLYLRGNAVVRDIDPYRIRLTLQCVSCRVFFRFSPCFFSADIVC